MYAALVRNLHKFILDIDVQINCVLVNAVEQLKKMSLCKDNFNVVFYNQVLSAHVYIFGEFFCVLHKVECQYST